MNDISAILASFRRIPHRSIGNDTFRKWFTKIGWKVYSDLATSIDRSALKDIELLFITLFSNRSDDLDGVIQLIRQKLGNHNDFEKFLNTLLYQTLIYYTKSFENNPEGWNILSDIISAFQKLILYCSDKENDPVYVFEDVMINAMEEMRSSKTLFPVLNTYFGVPIQFPATVVHTDDNSIIIKTKPIQIIAALIQKGIYILKNDWIDNDVFASVKVVNVQGERCLRLYNFNPLRTSFFQRQQVRVQTQAPFSVQVSFGNTIHSCSAHDISLKGSALTHHELIEIAPDQDVILIFPPQITSTAMRIKAKFVLRSSYESGYKYHFKLYPTLAQENLISYYISAREQQIIQSLRRKSQL